MRKSIILGTAVVIVITAFFYLTKKDGCIGLPSCEQYQYRYPKFYCNGILYVSGKRPEESKDAEQVVIDYLSSIGEQNIILLSTAKWADPYNWYQVTCRFENGREQGVEVGPDGNIYLIKRLK